MAVNYEKRLQNLQKKLAKFLVKAFLIESPIDIYYLTGIKLSTGILLVSAHDTVLIVDGRYYESCRMAFNHVVLLNDTTLIDLTRQLQIIGIDQETTTLSRFESLNKQLPEVTLKPISSPLEPLRIIKDKQEIDLLKKAAELGSKGYDYACSLLKPGVKEKDVALALEIFWLQNGAEKLAFEPIIAFGPHSALPHYRSGDGILKDNDCALIDIGVVKESYNSDMTRVKFFGDPPHPLKTIYQVVKEAFQAALESCKPGVTTGELDQRAREIIAQAGYGDNFTHSLGHGVGLEVHESPYLRNKIPFANIVLQKNMVITIEPGIYLSGIGGVRLENTILITENGFENLTLRTL